MGAVGGDTKGDFSLGGMLRIADSACENCWLGFVWDKGKVYRYGRDEIVGASPVEICCFSFAVIAGGALCDFGHHAVVIAIAAATDGYVRICRRRCEERRDQRQSEQQQQRDGDDAAHERPDAVMVGEQL